MRAFTFFNTGHPVYMKQRRYEAQQPRAIRSDLLYSLTYTRSRDEGGEEQRLWQQTKKGTRRQRNQRGRKRRKQNEGIGHMRLSSLYGLYFASWYLYLNSDGVTYEGGTHRTKKDKTKEPRRKAGERIGRWLRGRVGEEER